MAQPTLQTSPIRLPHQRHRAAIPDPIGQLQAALASLPTVEPDLGAWRWTVRRHLGGLRDLVADAGHAADVGLVARCALLDRERDSLLHRLADLGPRVLESADVEDLLADLRRLLADVSRHRQRRHDLAYDAVSLELGGSE